MFVSSIDSLFEEKSTNQLTKLGSNNVLAEERIKNVELTESHLIISPTDGGVGLNMELFSTNI